MQVRTLSMLQDCQVGPSNRRTLLAASCSAVQLPKWAECPLSLACPVPSQPVRPGPQARLPCDLQSGSGRVWSGLFCRPVATQVSSQPRKFVVVVGVVVVVVVVAIPSRARSALLAPLSICTARRRCHFRPPSVPRLDRPRRINIVSPAHHSATSRTHHCVTQQLRPAVPTRSLTRQPTKRSRQRKPWEEARTKKPTATTQSNGKILRQP